MSAIGQTGERRSPSRTTSLRLPRIPRGDLIGLSVGILAWEIGGRLVASPLIPPFTRVVARLGELIMSGQIADALVQSIGNLLLSLLIAIVLGIAIGALTGMSRRAAFALDPYVNALLTAPSLVFAPIFFSIWGLGRESIIALIVFYSLFVIIVNTQAAVRAASADLLEMARSYNATPWQAFRHIIIPNSLPLTLAGIRQGVGRAVKGMINGEMFIAVVGLGKLIVDGGRQLDASTVLATLVVVVAVGLGAMGITELIDRRLTRWLPRTARGSV